MKTFTNLTDVSTGNGPGQFPIGKCSEVLPNKMQCWRTADVLVTIASEPVTTEDGHATQAVLQYQKCRRHASIEQEAEITAQAAATAASNDAQQAAAQVQSDEAKLVADKAKLATK